MPGMRIMTRHADTYFFHWWKGQISYRLRGNLSRHIIRNREVKYSLTPKFGMGEW